MSIADEHIIKGCLSGDRNGQKALYEKYKVPMFRLCLRYARDRMEAEDMLQEGFIKVFSDLRQFNFRGAFGGWVRKVMVNVALQHIRKRKRLFPTVDLEYAHQEAEASNDILAGLNAKALTAMIQQLPPGYRAVFNMFVIEGYSHQEIAGQLEISTGTSKSQLSKAKAMLRQQINRAGVERTRSA